MQQSAIEEIELNIEELQKFVKKADVLDRLYANKDFQEVILDGFFTDEAVRLVHLKGDPSMQSEKNQESILRSIDGIGILKGYFSTIFQQASQAENTIAADREEIAEIESGAYEGEE